MTNKLVFIKNGVCDGDCCELTYYSPIIYDENNGLSVDNSIKVSCPSWMEPWEYVKLKNDVNYLINIDGNYGYIYDNIETSFSKMISTYILGELKELAFKESIYSSYRNYV